MRARSTLTVAVLGTTQTLAWASSYYLPAILADPIAAGLGVSKALFFGCFSASLLLQAALGPMIGKAIDHRGGRAYWSCRTWCWAPGSACSQWHEDRQDWPAP